MDESQAARTYEALLIFPPTLDEGGLKKAETRVREECRRLGGAVLSCQALGRRAFARKLGKHEAGIYTRWILSLAPEGVAAFRERLKLAGDVYRAQIVKTRTEAPAAVQEAAPPQGGQSDGHVEQGIPDRQPDA